MKNIEQLDCEAEIGKTYIVPILYGNIHTNGVPVINLCVADDFGSKEKHWHIDIRFATEDELRITHFTPIIETISGNYITIDISDSDYLMREKRICLRDYKDNYSPLNSFYLTEIHPRKMKMNCMKCPHKGYNLYQGPVSENGRKVTCPMHGLKWDMYTGEYCGQDYIDPTTEVLGGIYANND